MASDILLLKCPICCCHRSKDVAAQLKHIRIAHADSPNFWIQCDLQNCNRTYRKFTTYRNHIYSYHDTSYTATGTPPSTQSLSVNNGHVDLLADNDQHAPPQINDTNPHSIEGDSVELSSLTLLSL